MKERERLMNRRTMREKLKREGKRRETAKAVSRVNSRSQENLLLLLLLLLLTSCVHTKYRRTEVKLLLSL